MTYDEAFAELAKIRACFVDGLNIALADTLVGDVAFIAIAVLQKKKAPVEASPTSDESAYERTSPQSEGGP